MMKTAFLAAGTACAFFTVPSKVLAAPQPKTVELVNYLDLDLSSKAGRATLRWRIHVAAMDVCSVDRFLSAGCYDTAMADALHQAERAITDRRNSRSRADDALIPVSRRGL